MDLQTVASSFEGVKMNGTKNFICRCPCHDDREPSLIVSINNKKGKTWVNAHCFSECSKDDINRMLREKGFNQYQTAKRKTYKNDGGDIFVNPIPHKLMCEYRDTVLFKLYHHDKAWWYRDLFGKKTSQFFKPVTLIVTRTDKEDGKKEFCPHTLWKDKTTKEYKWLKKGPPSDWKRLPYFASGYLEADGIDTIMINEGEKSAHAGTNIMENTHPNIAHVSWMGGSQVPLKTNWEHFRGKGIKEFILVPDNDAPGRKAMKEIAEEVMKFCEKVTMIDTSSYPEKWDMADLGTEIKDGRKRYIEEELKHLGKLFEERFEVAQEDKQYAYIGELERFIDLNSGGFLSEKAFSNLMAPDRQDFKGAKDFMLTKGNILVPKLTFNPDTTKLVVEEDGIKKLNMYRPYHAVSSVGEVGRFLDHMNYLIPDEMNMKHVISWMAHICQWPTKKILHCLLLFSEAEGVGKTTLFKILQYALGHSLARQVQQHEIVSDFNPWAKNRLLVALEEIAIKGDYETRTTNMDKFKFLITEDTISINEKNVKQYEIPNRINLMMFSNSKAPITLGRLARRYYVWDCEARRKPDQYYVDFYSWLKEEGGFANVYDYLLKVDLSQWDCTKPPPKTTHFYKLVDRTQTPAHLELDELFESNSWPFTDNTILLSPAHLKKALSTIKINIGTNHITDWIKKRGGEKLTQIEWLNGERPTVWTTGDKEAFLNAKPKEIASHYLEPINDRGDLGWLDNAHQKRMQILKDLDTRVSAL